MNEMDSGLQEGEINLDDDEGGGMTYENVQALIEHNTEIIMKSLAPIKQFIVNNSSFRNIKRIGKGGYGEVYLSTHIPTGKKCAVKLLLIENLDEKQLQYFCREVMILARANNKFLLPFMGFTPTPPYLIVTEYVSRGSLFEALRHKPNSPTLNGTHKTIIALGIIRGMMYMHKEKIIHRDLKSLNILLDDLLLPKICDFGIARFVENHTQAVTKQLGTPHWMAPEIFETTNYTHKVDIYAFAIMMWEMLTESVPFKGKDGFQVAIAVTKNHERPPLPYNAPLNLKQLITQCWDDDPSKRPEFYEIFDQMVKEKIFFANTNAAKVNEFVRKFAAGDADVQSLVALEPETGEDIFMKWEAAHGRALPAPPPQEYQVPQPQIAIQPQYAQPNQYPNQAAPQLQVPIPVPPPLVQPVNLQAPEVGINNQEPPKVIIPPPIAQAPPPLIQQKPPVPQIKPFDKNAFQLPAMRNHKQQPAQPIGNNNIPLPIVPNRSQEVFHINNVSNVVPPPNVPPAYMKPRSSSVNEPQQPVINPPQTTFEQAKPPQSWLDSEEQFSQAPSSEQRPRYNPFVKNTVGEGKQPPPSMKAQLFHDIIEAVDLENSLEQFTRLLGIFEDSTPETILIDSFKDLAKLLQRLPQCVENFIKSGIYDLIPFENAKLTDSIIKILISVSYMHVDFITPEILERFMIPMQKAPHKALYFIHAFASFYPKSTHGKRIFNMFIKLQPLFSSSEQGCTYLRILYWDYYMNNQKLIEESLVSVCSDMMMRNQAEVIKRCYNILFKMDTDITQNHFLQNAVEHISNHTCVYEAVHFICKFKTLPGNSRLVRALVNVLDEVPNAILGLLRIALSTPKGAKIILTEVNFEKLVPIRAFELLLTIMAVPQFRSSVVELPSLIPILLSVIKQRNDHAMIGAIVTMIRRLNISTKFIEDLISMNFYNQFLHCTLGRIPQDDSLINCGLLLFDTIVRYESDKKAFTPEILCTLKYLPNILKNPRIGNSCLYTLVVLVYIPQSRPALLESGIPEAVAAMQLSPQDEDYQKTFLDLVRS